MANYKIGYCFDKSTKEFCGVEKVWEKFGGYPRASNVVFVEPPEAGLHEVAIWDGEGWQVEKDYRGCRKYAADGTPCGYVRDLGEDAIVVPPPAFEVGYSISWDASSATWSKALMAEYKLDGGKAVKKSVYELYADGLLSADEANERIIELRRAAYAERSTPLMSEAIEKDDDNLMQEYRAEVAKIKQELPKV